MIVKRNIEARSCNHCGRGNAISITYSESVFVALVIQHVMRMRHSVICGLSGPKIFLHIISQKVRFSGRKSHEMCVMIFSTNFV